MTSVVPRRILEHNGNWGNLSNTASHHLLEGNHECTALPGSCTGDSVGGNCAYWRTARRRGSRVPTSLRYGVDARSDSRDMRQRPDYWASPGGQAVGAGSAGRVCATAARRAALELHPQPAVLT